MPTIATLTVDLIAESAKFVSELDKANKGAENWAAKIKATAGVAGAAVAAAGVAAAAGFAALYTSSAKSIDQMGDLADSIGITTEKLGGLQYAAEYGGSSTETMNAALATMSKNLGLAANGSGKAAQTIKDLGLNNKEFFSLSPDKQFAAIADKINGLGTAQEKAAASTKIFGGAGVEMVNVLALGSKGLADAQAEAEAFGLTLNRVDTAKVQAANDAIQKAGQSTKALGNAIAVEAAPYVEELANEFVNATKSVGGYRDIVKTGIDYTVEGIGYAANVVRGLQVVWKGLTDYVANAFAIWLKGLVSVEHGIIDLANKIPGVNIQASKFLDDMLVSAEQVAKDVHQEFVELANKPLPHDGIVKWAEEVQQKATEAAEKVREDTAANVGKKFSGIPGGAPKATATKAEKLTLIKDPGYDQAKGELEQLNEYLRTKEQSEDEAFKRRQAIADNAYLVGLTSREKYLQMTADLERKHQEELKKINDEKTAKELEGNRLIYEGSAELFTSLAEITAEFRGKQNGMYKALFAASKAFAIAESIVKIQQGIAGAAALPFPANIPAMASVVAATAGIVATISKTNLKGMAHEGISNIPAEGTWLLQKGERVLSPRQNKDLTDYMKHGNGGNITIVNNTRSPIGKVTEQRMSPTERALILEEAETHIANRLADPNSRVSRSMASNTSVQRMR